MRRSFNKFMALMNLILSTNGGKDPETGQTKAPIKNRFVEGDHFYQGLTHKRIKGKWRVRR